MKGRRTLLAVVFLLGVAGAAYWKLAIPVHRVAVRSELIMLGDADGDHRWTAKDLAAFDAFAADPFRTGMSLAPSASTSLRKKLSTSP